MKIRIAIGLIVFCLSGVCITSSIAAQSNKRAQQILKHADDIFGSGSQESIIEFQIYKEGKLDNEYTLKSYLKGKDKMLLVFLKPPRIRNQVILRNKDDQWIYFPKLKRSMKVSLKNQFVGSDFSYGDILSIDLLSEYTPSIVQENVLMQNYPCVQLELSARKPTAIYNKVMYYIRQQDNAPIKREFYTKSGKMIKTLLFQDHREDKKPSRWVMTSQFNLNNHTIMIIKEAVEASLPDMIFTLEYVKRKY